MEKQLRLTPQERMNDYVGAVIRRDAYRGVCGGGGVHLRAGDLCAMGGCRAIRGVAAEDDPTAKRRHRQIAPLPGSSASSADEMACVL